MEGWQDLCEWVTETYVNTETDYAGSVWVNVHEDNECVLFSRLDDGRVSVEWHDWDGGMLDTFTVGVPVARLGVALALRMWFGSDSYAENGSWADWVRTANPGSLFGAVVAEGLA
jgi:hypothetical protein